MRAWLCLCLCLCLRWPCCLSLSLSLSLRDGGHRDKDVRLVDQVSIFVFKRDVTFRIQRLQQSGRERPGEDEGTRGTDKANSRAGRLVQDSAAEVSKGWVY